MSAPILNLDHFSLRSWAWRVIWNRGPKMKSKIECKITYSLSNEPSMNEAFCKPIHYWNSHVRVSSLKDAPTSHFKRQPYCFFFQEQNFFH